MDKSSKYTIFTAIVTSALLLSGCYNVKSEVNIVEEQSNTESIELTFFGDKVEPENVKVIEEILGSFMDEHPDIIITYESAKDDEYYELLDKRMKSGNGNDIFMVNLDTVLEYASLGYLEDLSKLPELSDFSDLALSQMYADNGCVYYVPTTISACGLFCNMDLLRAYRQAVPENYSEFKQVCDYFVEHGITPVIANNDISLKTVALAAAWYPYYADGTIEQVYDKINQGEASLSEYLKPGFNMVQEFIDKGYVDAEKTLDTGKTGDELLEFAKGKAPFMLTGAWANNRQRAITDFHYKIYAYPILENGETVVINTDTRMSINHDSEHIDEAKAFIQFFLKESNMAKFVDNQSSFSPLEYGENTSQIEMQPLNNTVSQGINIIGSDSNLNVKAWDISKDAVEMLLKGESWEKTAEYIDTNSNR